MAEEFLLPRDIRIKQQRPSLNKLPPQVAERVRDMWRLDGILSGFGHSLREHERLQQDRDRQNALFDKARFLCHSLLTPPVDLRSDEITKYQSELKALDDEFWAMPSMGGAVPPTELMRVNNWVDVTENDCARLACECGIAFMHSALEFMPESDEANIEKLPLLHCFRRLRNMVLHQKQSDVSQNEFRAKLVDGDSEDRQIAAIVSNAWFLVVKPGDLEATWGKQHPVMFCWFREMCDKYPARFFLQAAVEQLVSYYDAK
jgi:hypothetical protein